MAWYNPTDPKQRNLMVFGALALLAIVPWRMYVLSPRQEANAAVQTRVENLEQQNQRAEVLAARGGGDLEQRLALYERHVAKLEELIPAREEVAILLDDIQARARRVNVDVVSLDPEPRQQLVYYDMNAYSMSVVGEYHAVGRFLTEIAGLSRIVNALQLEVQLHTQPRQFPDMEFPVLASFRIETYVLPERPAQAAAPTPGGGE